MENCHPIASRRLQFHRNKQTKEERPLANCDWMIHEILVIKVHRISNEHKMQ